MGRAAATTLQCSFFLSYSWLALCLPKTGLVSSVSRVELLWGLWLPLPVLWQSRWTSSWLRCVLIHLMKTSVANIFLYFGVYSPLSLCLPTSHTSVRTWSNVIRRKRPQSHPVKHALNELMAPPMLLILKTPFLLGLLLFKMMDSVMQWRILTTARTLLLS